MNFLKNIYLTIIIQIKQFQSIQNNKNSIHILLQSQSLHLHHHKPQIHLSFPEFHCSHVFIFNKSFTIHENRLLICKNSNFFSKMNLTLNESRKSKRSKKHPWKRKIFASKMFLLWILVPFFLSEFHTLWKKIFILFLFTNFKLSEKDFIGGRHESQELWEFKKNQKKTYGFFWSDSDDFIIFLSAFKVGLDFLARSFFEEPKFWAELMRVFRGNNNGYLPTLRNFQKNFQASKMHVFRTSNLSIFRMFWDLT